MADKKARCPKCKHLVTISGNSLGTYYDWHDGDTGETLSGGGGPKAAPEPSENLCEGSEMKVRGYGPYGEVR